MEKMNFDFLKAGINEGRFTTISKNAKASDEIRPEFIANISINKMSLNGMASRMLKVETGDYLKAMILTDEQCGGDINKKFFIMVSKTKADDMMKLASVGNKPGVGEKLFMSYAACYPQFLQCTLDAQAITPDKLEELGFAYHIEKADKAGKVYRKYTANREVHYELIDTGIDYPNPDGTTLRIYACVNAQIIERPFDASVEDEDKEDVSETVADVEDAENANDVKEGKDEDKEDVSETVADVEDAENANDVKEGKDEEEDI